MTAPSQIGRLRVGGYQIWETDPCQKTCQSLGISEEPLRPQNPTPEAIPVDPSQGSKGT